MRFVLHVDDEPAVRRMFTRLLVGSRLTVDSADSLETALQRIAARDYDVVVVDGRVGSDDGIDVAERLLAEDPDLVVTLWLDDPSGNVRRDAMARGVAHCLDKRTSALELIGAVRALARGSGEVDIGAAR